jgi:hypothetical protein
LAKINKDHKIMVDQLSGMGKAFSYLETEQRNHSLQIRNLQKNTRTILKIWPGPTMANPAPCPPTPPSTLPKPKPSHKRDTSKDIHPHPLKKTKEKEKTTSYSPGSSYVNIAVTSPPASDSSTEKPKNLPVT